MRLLVLIYVVIGVLVAAARNYFERLDSVRGIVSLLIAILVWPVIVFDVDVRIGDENERNNGALLGIGLMWFSMRRLVARPNRSNG
jgi:hypothetical protein